MFIKDCKATERLQKAWDKKHPNDPRKIVKAFVRPSRGNSRFYWIALKTIDNGADQWRELVPTIAKARAEIFR